MGLVALAALAIAWPGLIPTEVVAVLICVAARRGSEPARGRLASLGVVLAAVYLVPLVNFVLPPLINPSFSDGPNWRRVWSPVFPIVPGTLPVVLVEAVVSLRGDAHPGVSPVVLFVLTSIATAAVVYALTLLAGRSRARRAVAATLGLLSSALGTHFMTIIVVARYM